MRFHTSKQPASATVLDPSALCDLLRQHYARDLTARQRDVLDTHLLTCPECLAWLLENSKALAKAA